MNEYEKDTRRMITALIGLLEMRGVISHSEGSAILDIPVADPNEEEV